MSKKNPRIKKSKGKKHESHGSLHEDETHEDHKSTR